MYYCYVWLAKKNKKERKKERVLWFPAKIHFITGPANEDLKTKVPILSPQSSVATLSLTHSHTENFSISEQKIHN